MIYSSPPAKVYIGKNLKGETPYQHKDMRLTFMSRKIRLEKDGYKPVEDKIRRSGRIGPLTAFFSVPLIFPVLWIGHYDPYYAYTLTPKGSNEQMKANFVKYKEPIKLKTKTYNPMYIGKGEKYHYVYHDNQISEFSKSFQLRKTEIVFDSKKPPTVFPIDGFVNGDKKHVIGVNGYQLRAITINKQGKSTVKDLTKIINTASIICPDYKFGYARSEIGKEIIAYDEDNVTVFDYNFSVKNKFSAKGSILEAEITSDGRVFSIEVTDGEVLFIQKGSKGKAVSVDLAKGRNLNFFRLNVNEKLNRAYVSYLISPKAKKVVLTKKQKRRQDSQSFISEGVQIVEFDLMTMKQLSSKTILFAKKIVSDARHAENGGIKYLVNRGVEANNGNTYITLEEQYIVVTTNENGSRSSFNANGIIIINAAKQSNPMQYISKGGASSHDFSRLSYNQIVKGDKIHFLFNNYIASGTRPVTHQIVFDSDLKVVSEDLFNLYKEGKTLLNTAYSYPLDDGSRLIFHVNKKRFGAAIIKFD